MKYLREKILGPRKKTTLDPGNTHEKNFWTYQGTVARWHETHNTHDDTRPTEFRILHKTLSLSNARRSALTRQKSAEKHNKELKKFNFLKLKPTPSSKNSTTDT